MPRSVHLRRPPHPGYERTDTPPNDHRIRARPARSSDGRPSRRLHSSRDSSFGVGSERTHFHRAIRSSGAARCPIEGSVNRGQFQACESSQLLLGIGVRAVLPPPLSLFDSYGGPSFWYLERITAYEDASVDKSLVVSPPSADVVVRLILLAAFKRLRRFIDQQGKLHHVSPFVVLALPNV